MMNRKTLLIGGGIALVVLLLLLRSRGSSGGTVQTIAPTPGPDTSAVDAAEMQGKYGIASQVLDIAGTLDVTNAQGYYAGLHDRNALDQIGANYAGQNTLLTTQGTYALALQNSSNKGALDIAKETTTQFGMATNRDISVATINGDTQKTVAKYAGEFAALQLYYDDQHAQDNNRTAVSINNRNASAAESNGKNSLWGHIIDGITTVGTAVIRGKPATVPTTIGGGYFTGRVGGQPHFG